MQVETQARRANAPETWDAIWRQEGRETWRKDALGGVYDRIEKLLEGVKPGPVIHDIGGGVGVLAARLAQGGKRGVCVWDHSKEALRQARDAGLRTQWADFEAGPGAFQPLPSHPAPGDILIATECVEHLSEKARDVFFRAATYACRALISVPNDRLGPDEEPQHTIKFTALEFLTLLRRHFGVDRARVECIDGYLLGVCGFPKTFRLSVTMPVRDEAADIGRTLASFRGIADEIVIGVDPRTTDATREIAKKYAEVVFDLETPQGPAEDGVPEAGVHFSWIRNQCIDKCFMDPPPPSVAVLWPTKKAIERASAVYEKMANSWIFMSEGHESLATGQDTLLALDRVMPAGAQVGLVFRTSHTQRWAFPWLFKKHPKIRFKRATHNTLDYPDDFLTVRMPQVSTLHERTHAKDVERAAQRKVQNRKNLMEDWVVNGNDNSLYYLATEWGEHDPRRSIERLREFLALPSKNGPARYHARLVLAKTLACENRLTETRDVLLAACADDWSRSEHWLWLGDLAHKEGKVEQALVWYGYAASRIGEPPFTTWWIDLACYSYLPAQRMAMVLAAIGKIEDALSWARRVVELLPEDAPDEMKAEAADNVTAIERFRDERRKQSA